MISSEPNSSDGGKRSVDFEINLIPFIDLMSMAISFLLITAVWTQVSMIQIGSSIYGKKTDSGHVEQPQREQVNLRVDVTDHGYTVAAGRQTVRIPKKSALYDQESLESYLKDLKTRYPDKTDAIISVLDHIKYEELIHGMDALMLAGFPEIAIATQGVE